MLVNEFDFRDTCVTFFMIEIIVSVIMPGLEEDDILCIISYSFAYFA